MPIGQDLHFALSKGKLHVLQLISHFEEMVRTNSIKIRSIRVIHEMKTFIFKNGRPDHMEGYNDDLIINYNMKIYLTNILIYKMVHQIK